MDTLRIGSCTLRLVQGDITEQDVDAIVNAANSTLMGGGGVDGAIHRRGGSTILAECKLIRATRYPDGLPTGRAVITTGGALVARHVIHTVGPVWRGGAEGEPELLARAYRSVVECARAEGLHTIAFPSISTGAYGYPVESAALIALSTLHAALSETAADSLEEVHFVLFSTADLDAYRGVLEQIAGA